MPRSAGSSGSRSRAGRRAGSLAGRWRRLENHRRAVGSPPESRGQPLNRHCSRANNGEAMRYLAVLAPLLLAACGSTMSITVTATETRTTTVTASPPPKPLRLPSLQQLAVARSGLWWWTEERAEHLLEANALWALHDVPQFAAWNVEAPHCTGTGARIHYLARKPLFSEFNCLVSTFVGVSTIQHGPTLNLSVMTRTRDYFDVDLLP